MKKVMKVLKVLLMGWGLIALVWSIVAFIIWVFVMHVIWLFGLIWIYERVTG